jgi:hypothetical protein
VVHAEACSRTSPLGSHRIQSQAFLLALVESMSLQVSPKVGAERLDCMIADSEYRPVLGILHVVVVYC